MTSQHNFSMIGVPKKLITKWFPKVHWEKHWGYGGYTDLGQWQIMKYKTGKSKIISKIQYRPCNVHISICCTASNLMTDSKCLRTYSQGRWYKQYINSFSSVVIYGVFFLTRITRIIFFSVLLSFRYLEIEPPKWVGSPVSLKHHALKGYEQKQKISKERK